jgi:hypothetical protein
MKLVNQDEEHLRLLAIFYYIWGGLTAVFSCLGVFYVALGGVFMVAAAREQQGPPIWVGTIFSLFGAAMVLLVLIVAGLTLWTGRNLQRRKHYVACLIVAGFSCLSVPLGTALGVFTFVVLSRPSVKQLFADPAAT